MDLRSGVLFFPGMVQVSTRATQQPMNYAKSIVLPDFSVSSALRTNIKLTSGPKFRAVF